MVPDTVYTTTLERDRPPTYYLMLEKNYESAVALHVHAAGNPMSLVPAIRQAVRQVDGQLAVERPQRLRDVLDRTLSGQRMMATLVGLFGATALMLAVLGRLWRHGARRESADGGDRHSSCHRRPAGINCQFAVGTGLRLLGLGTNRVLAGAFLGTRYIEAQLFGVTATDPLTFAGGCVVLAIAGLAAALIPALRAMRVDRIGTLRQS